MTIAEQIKQEYRADLEMMHAKASQFGYREEKKSLFDEDDYLPLIRFIDDSCLRFRIRMGAVIDAF